MLKYISEESQRKIIFINRYKTNETKSWSVTESV